MKELAKLTLQATQDVKFDKKYNDKLIKFINDKNEDDINFWLDINSFEKWQILEAIEKNKYEEGKEPPKKLLNDIQTIIVSYLEKVEQKKNIRKFELSDAIPFFKNGEFSSSDTLKKEHLLNLEDHSKMMSYSNLKLLLNAYNRRSKRERGNFNGLRISGIDALFKEIKNIKNLERKQIIYYHSGNSFHAIGFDIEHTSDGKLNIFYIDSAKDESCSEILYLLGKGLTEINQSFEIKCCESALQKDNELCQTYAAVILKELSKYPHVFSYLPKIVNDNKINKEKFHKELLYSLSRSNIYYYGIYDIEEKYLINIENVKTYDLPTKIIAMAQSYTDMEANLKQSSFLISNVYVFIKKHKINYNFDVKKEDEKYINKRRKNIGKHFENEIISIEQETVLAKKQQALDFIANQSVENIIKELDKKALTKELSVLIKNSTFKIQDVSKLIKKWLEENGENLKKHEKDYSEIVLFLNNYIEKCYFLKDDPNNIEIALMDLEYSKNPSDSIEKIVKDYVEFKKEKWFDSDGMLWKKIQNKIIHEAVEKYRKARLEKIEELKSDEENLKKDDRIKDKERCLYYYRFIRLAPLFVGGGCMIQ